MPRQFTSILGYLRRLVEVDRAAALPDGQLLNRFVLGEEEGAFEVLLSRYGPLVWSVCRRVLPDIHEAEDAFQATFLVLVRKAASIRNQASLRSWLYGVAWRVAKRARSRIQPVTLTPNLWEHWPSSPVAEAQAWRTLQPVLDEELNRLPEKFRLPLLLCYLEGKTRDEAAQELGWTPGMVKGRLERGRERLRRQLQRRGLVLSAALFPSMLIQGKILASVPPALLMSTAQAALAGKVAAPVAALAKGVMQVMFWKKLTIIMACLLVGGLAASAVSLVAFGTAGDSATVLAQGAGPVAAVQGKPSEKPGPGTFYGRRGAVRELALRSGGGTKESEACLARGLRWLLKAQGAEGQWSIQGPFQGQGTHVDDVAGTAFGLLPLLGTGKTHLAKDAPYDQPIAKALAYLLRQQQQTGMLGQGMYAHGLATIALGEAYGLSQDQNLRRPAQLAVNYIINAQHDKGGWRYAPKQAGDTSVTGWQVMALLTAQMAGLEVPEAALKKTGRFLDDMRNGDNEGYGYTTADSTPSMSAVGLLCRQYLQSWGPQNVRMTTGIAKNLQPPADDKAIYYYYFATQVMHHVGGRTWKDWNEKMREILIKSQEKDGSWSSPADGYALAGGRLMQTSLSLLTLEVYYRHLPLFWGGKELQPDQEGKLTDRQMAALARETAQKGQFQELQEIRSANPHLGKPWVLEQPFRQNRFWCVLHGYTPAAPDRSFLVVSRAGQARLVKKITEGDFAGILATEDRAGWTDDQYLQAAILYIHLTGTQHQDGWKVLQSPESFLAIKFNMFPENEKKRAEAAKRIEKPGIKREGDKVQVSLWAWHLIGGSLQKWTIEFTSKNVHVMCQGHGQFGGGGYD